jgi:hypothetical protein
MRLSKILTATAMVSLVIAPIAAQAATPVRAASTQDGEDIAGISPILLVLAAAVLIGVIVIVADDNNKPASP